MAKTVHTISCTCDEDYRELLGIVALTRKQKIGDLVRGCLDSCLGDELKAADAFRYAQASSQKHNDVHDKTRRGE